MRKFLLLLIVFLSGFFVHAFLFPDWFTTGFNTTVNNVLGTESSPNQKSKIRALTTVVSYKNGAFKPRIVFIEKGTYLSVRNDDEKELMWLASVKQPFNTQRGFGQGETVTIRLDQPDNFKIIDKLNPQAQLTVVVK